MQDQWQKSLLGGKRFDADDVFFYEDETDAIYRRPVNVDGHLSPDSPNEVAVGDFYDADMLTELFGDNLRVAKERSIPAIGPAELLDSDATRHAEDTDE